MIEVEIDKSEPEGNGYATGGKFIFGSKETSIPFKSTSISKTNSSEYDILDNENIHSPREYFALIHNREHAFNLFGEKEDSLLIRTEFHENINRTFEKISTKKDFNFVYLYFKESLPKINRKIAENMYDVLDSPYNHLLVIPMPLSIDNIESVKTLVDVFKNRESMVDLERPLMGTIPHSINENSMGELINFYIENEINVFGIDMNGTRPRGLILNLIKRKIIENDKIKKNNYFLYLFNLAKAQYIRRNVRPVHDILTVMYGVDGFNNQRFARGGSKWANLTPKQQQNKIDNVRFRIIYDYGEYNKFGLLESEFTFDKNNETTILNKKSYNTIYDIEKTKKAYDTLYQNSKWHNWILTHKELNTSVRKEIENQRLLNYFKDKKYIKNEIDSYLLENPNLKKFKTEKMSII
jgi:hypothetical protein